jgi:hypothetical protein
MIDVLSTYIYECGERRPVIPGIGTAFGDGAFHLAASDIERSGRR